MFAGGAEAGDFPLKMASPETPPNQQVPLELGEALTSFGPPFLPPSTEHKGQKVEAASWLDFD